MLAVKPQSLLEDEGTAALASISPEGSDTPAWRVGPYEIRDKIGQGGMATVYRAWHTNLHRFEALKIPRREGGVDSEYIPRLLAEARMAARLFHPHIVAIHNISEDGAAEPYFSMDLVEGQDLSLLLKERGSLPLSEIVEIVRQTASGISHAHQQNVVHRDIKPENILLQPVAGGKWLVKVVDFGISRAAEDQEGTRLTRSGMMVGTPEYMSPEQSGSGAPVDFRTDIYSLGIVAYEMLTGEPPFSVGTDVSRMAILISHARDLPRAPLDVNPAIPSEVSDVVMRALAKNPDDRFSSADEFAAALEKAAQPALAVVPKAFPRGSQRIGLLENRRGWATMACAVAIGVLIGWLGSTMSDRPSVATASDLPSVTKPVSKAKLATASPVIRKQTLRRAIAFKKTKRPSTSLLKGQHKVTQKGAPGLREIVLQTSLQGGKELSRRQVSSRVVRAAVPQIEMIGTRAPVRKAAPRKVVHRKVRATPSRTRSVLRSSFAPRRAAPAPKRRSVPRVRSTKRVRTQRIDSYKVLRKRILRSKRTKKSRRSNRSMPPGNQVLGSFRILTLPGN